MERYRGEKANVIFDIHRSVTRSAGSYIFFLLLQGLHPLSRVYPCLLSFTRSAGVNCSADYVCVILKPRGRCNRNAGEKTVLPRPPTPEADIVLPQAGFRRPPRGRFRPEGISFKKHGAGSIRSTGLKSRAPTDVYLAKFQVRKQSLS